MHNIVVIMKLGASPWLEPAALVRTGLQLV